MGRAGQMGSNLQQGYLAPGTNRAPRLIESNTQLAERTNTPHILIIRLISADKDPNPAPGLVESNAQLTGLSNTPHILIIRLISADKDPNLGCFSERPCRPKCKYTLHKRSMDPTYLTVSESNS